MPIKKRGCHQNPTTRRNINSTNNWIQLLPSRYLFLEFDSVALKENFFASLLLTIRSDYLCFVLYCRLNWNKLIDNIIPKYNELKTNVDRLALAWIQFPKYSLPRKKKSLTYKYNFANLIVDYELWYDDLNDFYPLYVIGGELGLHHGFAKLRPTL